MTIVLESPGGARATVTEHGAHVLSWTPAAGDERLFLSARSRFGDGASIRGGIPVIFPQFAAFGPLPKHGFARTRPWTTLHVSPDSATFELSADAATRAIWPHEFAARVVVRVDDASVAVTLTVENRDPAAFSFAAALHFPAQWDPKLGIHVT